jgi:hypothetical protein
MKRFFLFILCTILFTSTSLFSQLNKPTATPPMLKPVFNVEDVVFVYQTLDNIDIAGSEVDAFLEVRDFLQKTIKSIQDAKKQQGDTYQVEIPLPLAQNMVTFLTRAKFSGKNADMYKRFYDALVESSKALQSQGK